MEQIFTADQKPRLENLPPAAFKAKWGDLNAADAARREQVRSLMTDGELHTGKDFWEAAFIFQHSPDPNDYLLAHTLASIALAKGNNDGLWIMTASLDRYLHSIHQPQIYGTQSHRSNGNEPFTKEPYNHGLISDALRKELGIPSQAEQLKELEQPERKSCALAVYSQSVARTNTSHRQTRFAYARDQSPYVISLHICACGKLIGFAATTVWFVAAAL